MKRTRNLLATAFMLTILSCGQGEADSTNTDDPSDTPVTVPVTNISATKDQSERRARSEAICKANGIPVYKNPNSLFVEPEEKVTLRTQDEVVDRALALCYIGLKSEGLGQEQLDKMDKDYGISAKLSPNEKAYATAKQATEQQKIDGLWRYESLHVLLWALGYVDSLSFPDKICNVGDDVKIIYELKESGFRQKARLRSKKEILDQADLILRFDWACVSANLEGKPMPGRLDKGVVFERHHTLNWLIQYMNQNWDDVTTDT
ncbi:DUF4272 domain-containing protein [Terrimonas sp. NA20]|uniref:DUF4272 domain-containing protein n=1 Tax=Terrimonas ginsenosidimutans TaxID=2908004 RepID=A0ABS9KPR8_9BACT|nr:DUF4272 domain-containing protein [Terrimonas ginsenosidimutans]MCG2614331.1 DUF4272 domain-containing protein [Terrimonas ginsenosidimutans]